MLLHALSPSSKRQSQSSKYLHCHVAQPHLTQMVSCVCPRYKLYRYLYRTLLWNHFISIPWKPSRKSTEKSNTNDQDAYLRMSIFPPFFPPSNPTKSKPLLIHSHSSSHLTILKDLHGRIRGLRLRRALPSHRYPVLSTSSLLYSILSFLVFIIPIFLTSHYAHQSINKTLREGCRFLCTAWEESI